MSQQIDEVKVGMTKALLSKKLFKHLIDHSKHCQKFQILLWLSLSMSKQQIPSIDD